MNLTTVLDVHNAEEQQAAFPLNAIIHGNTLDVLRTFPDDSIDMIMTSPALTMYIDHLCLIFDEAKRVLKPTGTCWVNLGDSYASRGSVKSRWAADGKLSKAHMGRGRTNEIVAKSLCQIPSLSDRDDQSRLYPAQRNHLVEAKLYALVRPGSFHSGF